MKKPNQRPQTNDTGGDEGLNILHHKRPDKTLSTLSPSELSRPRLDFHAVKSALEIATGMEVIYEGPSQIFADRKIMFRILLNLARNAGIVGATELKIDIWRAGHLGVIDILDNGPGISEDARRTLFQAFKTKAGNTGLCLAIARDLAVALGGNLKLTRSNQDGSEFRLQLPKQIFLN